MVTVTVFVRVFVTVFVGVGVGVGVPHSQKKGSLHPKDRGPVVVPLKLVELIYDVTPVNV